MSRSETRTKQEVAANTFDCELFTLVCRAEALDNERNGEWAKISYALHLIRRSVRKMMHKKDREDTR